MEDGGWGSELTADGRWPLSHVKPDLGPVRCHWRVAGFTLSLLFVHTRLGGDPLRAGAKTTPDSVPDPAASLCFVRCKTLPSSPISNLALYVYSPQILLNT